MRTQVYHNITDARGFYIYIKAIKLDVCTDNVIQHILKCLLLESNIQCCSE